MRMSISVASENICRDFKNNLVGTSQEEKYLEKYWWNI
jgi:hypothetical protein